MRKDSNREDCKKRTRARRFGFAVLIGALSATVVKFRWRLLLTETRWYVDDRRAFQQLHAALRCIVAPYFFFV